MLNKLLTSAPIPKLPNLEKYFVICIDACKLVIGRVIIQDSFVACYESIKLKENANSYFTCDLELVSIIHTLKMWMNYLMGRKFELKIKQCGPNYLFEYPIVNERKARCLEIKQSG